VDIVGTRNCSKSGRAVDAFTEEVGVSVVPGVLGDHVDQDSSKRDRLTVGLHDAGLVQGGCAGDDVVGALTFVPPDGEGVGHVSVEPVEVLVGVVVGVVEEGNVFAGELNPKSPPLYTGEVADQPVQAQRRRGDVAFGEPGWG
jgi:hypothetical protein